MYALSVVGGILLILLLKKLFHRVTDDAPAKRNDDEASSSTTQEHAEDVNPFRVPASRKEYEVFLSFRGSDTRTTFTDYLYEALDSKGIHTFRDNEKLQKGEKIAEELKSAIHRSKIAIIIFSKGYASSKWCLRELAEISKCRKKEGQTQIIAFPVFYHVDPTEVRNQTGSYGTAFQHHEKEFNKETLEGWRKALRDVGELKGWDLKNTADGHEGKLVRLIVEQVWSKLDKIPLDISRDIVGMDYHVERIEELLSTESKQIVGIYGLGGIGKTTIAKCVYNKVYSNFEGCCFLEDFRETAKTQQGLVLLQSQLVNNILNQKNTNINSVLQGTVLIKERLSAKKVLIILDDADGDTDLNAIMGEGDWFGVGSKIIITTRDKQVLNNLGVDISAYKPNEMDSNQSLILFSKYAFKMDHPSEKYLELSRHVVKTTGGLPLALKVIGSHLYLKGELAWNEAVKNLANTPHKKVQEKLRISYDALDYEEKMIFLDIACFFFGMRKEVACRIWDGSNFAPYLGIENLCLKSLIEINEENELSMHDQLRDLGRDIVRKENYKVLGERSRLWSPKDVKEILSTQQGTSKVEGLCLFRTFIFRSRCEDIIIRGFGAMTGLRILEVNYAKVASDLEYSFPNLIYLSWQGCPEQFVPNNLRRLCFLDLSCSPNIKNDWKGWKYIEEVETLKVLNLSKCYKLSRTPNFSANKQLEELYFDCCVKLVEVDESIGDLKSLVTLSLPHTGIKYLPNSICELSRLRILRVHWSGICQLPERWVQLQPLTELHFDFSKIQLPYLPNLEILSTGLYDHSYKTSENMDIIQFPELPRSLRYLDASTCKIKSLPPSLQDLTNLEKLYLNNCPNLVEISTAINALSSLKTLQIKWCPHLQCVPRLPSALECIQIGVCENLRAISGFSDLRNLRNLEIKDCSKLAKIESLEGLDSLRELEMQDCPSVAKLPKLQCLENLCELYLHNVGLSEIEGLEGLTRVSISNCKFLRIIPNLSSDSKNLVSIEIVDCDELSEVVGLEKLDSLKRLEMHKCHSLLKLPEKLDSLEELKMENCPSLAKLPEKLDSLEELKMENCPSLAKLPNLPNLKELDLEEIGLSEIEGLGVEGLENLFISSCKFLRIISNLSDSKNLVRILIRSCNELLSIVGLEKLGSLKELHIFNCPSLIIRELPKGLCDLTISLDDESLIEELEDLKSLEKLSLSWLSRSPPLRVPDLSNMKALWELELCDPPVLETNFFQALEFLGELTIFEFGSVEVLPDLSPLKNLRELWLCDCEQLMEMPGIGKLESLESLVVTLCKSLEIFPNISELKKLTILEIDFCEKLTTIQGLDRLENLTHLYINGCRRNITASVHINS